jgi:hypothetical protein
MKAVFWNTFDDKQALENSEIGPGAVIVGAGIAFEAAMHGSGFVRTESGKFNSNLPQVQIPPSILYDLFDEGTIEFWIVPKVSQPAPYQYGVFYLFDNYFVPDVNVKIYWGDGVSGRGLGAAVRFDNRSAVTTPPEKVQFVADPGKPFHVALTWDVSGIDGGGDTVRLYRDGQVVAAASFKWNLDAPVYNTDPIILGVGPDPKGFNKFITDDLIIWDGAKTDFSDRFTPGPDDVAPAAAIGLGRTEAEALDLGSGFVAETSAQASGGGYVRGRKTGDVSASGVFAGPAGTYALKVGYFDENDGVSRMEVHVNGAVVDGWDWDGSFGDDCLSGAGRAERVIAGLDLKPGDRIELSGARGGGEPLRTDWIEVTALPEIGTGRTEAEALGLVSGFAAKAHAPSSGDAFIASQGDGEARAGAVFSGAAGLYDLRVGHYDESDGVSRMEIRVNGAAVDAWDWDGAGGAALPTAASRATRVAEKVALAPGDVIELVGAKDGTEPLRTDWIEVVRSPDPPPPPKPSVLGLGRHEAETLGGLVGFAVEANSDASGGFVIAASGDGDHFIPFYIVPPFYVNDGYTEVLVTIGYIDEPDGLGRMTYDGREGWADWLWNSSAGSSASGDGTFVYRTILEIAYEPGGIYGGPSFARFVAFPDGGEGMRVDWIEIAVDTPPFAASPGLDVFNHLTGLAYLQGPTREFTADKGDVIPAGVRRFADVDGDGKLDAVIASATGLSVALNDFTSDVGVSKGPWFGGFTAGAQIAGDFARNGLALGDMDGDGDPDAVAISGANVTVLLNDGRGAFAIHASFAASQPVRSLSQLSLGDIDGDGDLDIVSNVTLLNDGGGALAEAPSLAPETAGTVQLADFNADGALDIAYANVAFSMEAPYPANPSILEKVRTISAEVRLAQPDGTHGAPITAFQSKAIDYDGQYNSYDNIYDMPLADFDGDGSVDIGVEIGTVKFDPEDNKYRFEIRRFDDAAGEFAPLSTLPVSSWQPEGRYGSAFSHRPAAGDIDGDGDVDLLFAYGAYRDNGAQLFLNDGAGNFSLVNESFSPGVFDWQEGRFPNWTLDPEMVALDELVAPYAVSDPGDLSGL